MGIFHRLRFAFHAALLAVCIARPPAAGAANNTWTGSGSANSWVIGANATQSFWALGDRYWHNDQPARYGKLDFTFQYAWM